MRRTAFTLTELSVAMTVATVALGLVCSLAAWSLEDRQAHHDRLRATEAAANLLEAAAALGADALTPAWAASQKLPDDVGLTNGTLTVTAAPEEGTPNLIRVTARVTWNGRGDLPGRHVELFACFAKGGLR